MSGFIDALRKFRKTGSKAHDRKPDGFDLHSTNGVSPDGGVDDDMPGFQHGNYVDIPLDKDLAAYAERSKHARQEEVELDFDLTGPGMNEPSALELQVLSIDPTRSFSHQIDLNLRKLAMQEFITPDNVSTPLSHNFRRLKRPILNNVLGKGATVLDNANLVMFTSSFPNEGKTFSAINMAMSIALERDKRVLLIDADVTKPSHHDIFGVEMQSGIMDLLMGEVDDVSKIIYKTNLPSLSLMFSGHMTPHAPELFASQAMETFVTELSKRYDDRVIVFDAAPLLLPTEASVLASLMGQIVLVIEAEKTRPNDVKMSLDMLSNRIVLLLLNKVRAGNDMAGYGYGYGYGYGNQKD